MVEIACNIVTSLYVETSCSVVRAVFSFSQVTLVSETFSRAAVASSGLSPCHMSSGGSLERSACVKSYLVEYHQ